jgi:hypothetical protein
MPRKRKNLSLDETVIEGIERLCKRTDTRSFSLYVEQLLTAHLISNNVVSPTYKPLGETRGGDRTQSTNKEAAK